MKAPDKAKVIKTIAATITDRPTDWRVIVEAVEAAGVTVGDWREVRDVLQTLVSQEKYHRLPTINVEAYVTFNAPILFARTTARMMANALSREGYKACGVVEPTATEPGRVDITEGVYVEVTMTALSMFYRKGDGTWSQYGAAEPMEWAIEIIGALNWLLYRYPEHENIKAA